MDIKTMTIEDIEVRMAEIDKELDTAENLDELKEEVRALKERKAEIKTEAEKAKEERKAAAEEGIAVKSFANEEKEERTMDVKEIRNSKEYIDAYAEYLKTGDDREVRKIITVNGAGDETDGIIEVPVFVEDGIKTAWENDAIFSRVRRTYAKGNLRVGFELSASDAVAHTEGASRPAEETLLLGSVELIPKSVKKWITFSDELYDTREEFLTYIYDELTYKIIQFCKQWVGLLISNAPAVSDDSHVGVPAVSGAPEAETLVNALGLLSDEATEPVAVMNKQTWAAIKAAALNAGYAYDPFAGMDVAFDNNLPAYSTASANAVYMYVADLGKGITANFPNGDEVKLKFDDLSLAESDLIKVVGRLYVAVGLTAPGMAVKVTKPTE